MGEARRRRLAGTYPAQTQPLSRTDAIAWAWDILADGSEPVYLSADDAKRPPGRRH